MIVGAPYADSNSGSDSGAAYVVFGSSGGFRPVLGRDSAGVPDTVHEAADVRLVIPMRPGMRSINVAQAGAMVLGEALRQTGAFPGGPA